MLTHLRFLADSRLMGLSGMAMGILIFTGCSHTVDTSHLMRDASAPTNAPPGKAMVCFHFPVIQLGGGNAYAGIWDGQPFIGDVGPGQSMAYTCSPGKHFFIGRSAELASVIEADLEAGKIYDVEARFGGAFALSFQLEPVKAGDTKARTRANNMVMNNRWVSPTGSRPANYDRALTEVNRCLNDFVHGHKRDRLRILSSDDHR